MGGAVVHAGTSEGPGMKGGWLRSGSRLLEGEEGSRLVSGKKGGVEEALRVG